MSYWADRMAKSQDRLSKKNIAAIEAQIKKYYGNAARQIIADFEATYNKILAQQEEGKTPTPADLYKLDKYWAMQGQMRQELRKLGEKQIAALTKQFEVQFFDVYYSIGIEGAEAFSTIDKSMVDQLINQIWCADGKSWSQRIWGNTERLAEKLNEQLVNSLITGSKTSDLKRILQEEFNVSYSRADALVRTEMAHIQTQSAQQRYKDYGVEMVEVWVDEDEKTCPICAKHEGEKYPINARMPVPFHPRCRCCMIPVVDDNERKEKVMEKEFDRMTAQQVGKEMRDGKYMVLVKDANGNSTSFELSEWNHLKYEQYSTNWQQAERLRAAERQREITQLINNNKTIIFDENLREEAHVYVCEHCYERFTGYYYGRYVTCPNCGKETENDYKYLYKNPQGESVELTWDEKKAREEVLKYNKAQEEMARQQAEKELELAKQREAQARAIEKAGRETTESNPYATKPLQKQIEEAKTKKGLFEYYTHHCKQCGGYFDSTVADKKKCPLCGAELSGTRSTAQKHTIHNKVCTECGEMFSPTSSSQTICSNCQSSILTSPDAIRLKKHGYTERGVIKALAGEQGGYGRERKSGFDMYWEYIKKHPEQREEIDAIPYTERDKHFITCIDCGDVVYIANKNNNQKRCPECQAIYRKKYKAQKEKERRAKKKN